MSKENRGTDIIAGVPSVAGLAEMQNACNVYPDTSTDFQSVLEDKKLLGIIVEIPDREFLPDDYRHHLALRATDVLIVLTSSAVERSLLLDIDDVVRLISRTEIDAWSDEIRLATPSLTDDRLPRYNSRNDPRVPSAKSLWRRVLPLCFGPCRRRSVQNAF